MSFMHLFGSAPVSPRSTRTRRSTPAAHWTEPLERRLLLANVPDGFTDEEISTGIDSPTAMEIAPDGKIFVAGQKGHLWIVENGNRRQLMQIPNVNSADERGFLGVELDPAFSSNGQLYVYYTRNHGGGTNNRVARYTFDGTNIVGDETVIIDLPDISGAIFHMGGAIHFGPDGKLYIAVGDYQNPGNSQSLNTLSGKMLRINPDGSIPTDNPFFNDTSGANRAIWAIGLRNPFTFNFQPGTGRMFINDVGQETWEEINEGAPGANYGWPASEGPDNTSGFTGPVYYYDHGQGRCSIAGGVFYNPSTITFPSQYVGKYYFADLCAGWIRMLDTSTFTAEQFASGLSFPVDLDVGPDGSMYYLNRGTAIDSGHIGRISFASVGAPVLSTQPQSQTVSPGGTATFFVVASGAGPLNYQWQFNGDDIAGATGSTLTINNVQQSDAGQYRVVVSNNAGSTTSNAATLTVIAGNAPNAVIDSPAPGTTFRGGQTFTFSGRATDPEDGELGPNRITWQVDYHTGSVVRPFVAERTGNSGTFTIPTETPFKATNVFYRVRMTATDSNGLSTTVTRDIAPVVARLNLRSNVPGVTVFLDGQPRETPFGTEAVAGIRRDLSADQEIQINGVTYLFDGWSDGGGREHEISSGVSDMTYTARYRVKPEVTTTKGLAMTIFNNRDRTGTMVTGNVPSIDFDWGTGSPDPMIHPDTFFIRFRGKVQPEFTETYTFYTQADDGVRLFVNGQLLIDQWNDSGGEELSGSIDLVAGQKYDLRFDYFENLGDAKARLLWSSPSTPKQVIPRNKFFAQIMPQTLTPTADSFVHGGAPRTNYGDITSLLLKSAAAERYQREIYLKFDISDLDISRMGSAKLRFFGRLSATEEINVNTGLYEAPRAKWGERSITWQNRPEASAKTIATATVANAVNQFWEFDITNFLRQQKEAGRTIVTFVVRNLDETTVFTRLYSRESAVNQPQLIVSV